ncbi:serine hydrolase domain-containing protein [Novosphingopyxis sp.]|uniref:serine hydrolase domain-containing protein n=1 Tax=Novosphingopyxis sp. TaxID=2709690 RepID=UPI003B5C1E0C
MPRNKSLALATAFAPLMLLAACGPDAPEPVAAPPPCDARCDYIAADSPVDRAALDARIDPLFADPAMAETRALVVMRYGHVVAERYAPGYSSATPLIGWSMEKSVTAVLIGMLVADGRLRLDDPAPISEWQSPGDPRRDITLRHLLHMASGLDHTEGLDPDQPGEIYDGDTPRMLFTDGADDMARYAESRPMEARPGEKFEYSSATTVILGDIVARELTASKDPRIRMEAVRRFAQGRLFEPLGMASAVLEFDRAGTLIGGSIMHATARDWARFGEFLRTGGSIGGAQLIPRKWIAFMRTPSPANAVYGGHIWLNARAGADGLPILFPDAAPPSAFAALGHLGQYVIVSPQQGLTVVRLGKTQDEERQAVRDQLGRVANLFPVGK